MPDRVGRVLVCALLACGLLALIPAEASAAVLTFIHQGSGSGTLDSVPFPISQFVITGIGNTANRYAHSQGWGIPHDSASIWISGLGTYTFLIPTHTFVNNVSPCVGFSRGGDLFNGPRGAPFDTWNMLSPIGPISGPGTLFQWSSSLGTVYTSGGILYFNNASVDAIFQAAVPEPSTLALLGGLGLMLARRRR